MNKEESCESGTPPHTTPRFLLLLFPVYEVLGDEACRTSIQVNKQHLRAKTNKKHVPGGIFSPAAGFPWLLFFNLSTSFVVLFSTSSALHPLFVLLAPGLSRQGHGFGVFFL